jgi:hypothetical protein
MVLYVKEMKHKNIYLYFKLQNIHNVLGKLQTKVL